MFARERDLKNRSSKISSNHRFQCSIRHFYHTTNKNIVNFKHDLEKKIIRVAYDRKTNLFLRIIRIPGPEK